MGVELPEIGWQEFGDRIRAGSPETLDRQQLEQLFLHYAELRRWNRRVSLVGPAEAESVVERHYVDSLAALPFLPRSEGTLVDLGAGAGFPGFVLAVVRRNLAVTLVEARGRKWSFLKSVCRRVSLSCNCVNARVGAAPPEGLPRRIDWVTCRAVRFEQMGFSSLLPRLAPDGSLLIWAGVANPLLPTGLEIVRSVPVEGTSHRRILEIRRVGGERVGS